MSWFSSHRFYNKKGRLSVDEYVAKVKQSEDEKNAEHEQKAVLKPELISLLQKLKDSLKEKGLGVSFKEIVDNIYIPEIENDTWPPEVSFIFYKNMTFQITKDDKVF